MKRKKLRAVVTNHAQYQDDIDFFLAVSQHCDTESLNQSSFLNVRRSVGSGNIWEMLINMITTYI